MGNSNEHEKKPAEVVLPPQSESVGSPQRPAKLVKLSLGNSGSKRSPEKPLTKDEAYDLIPQMIQEAIDRKGSPNIRMAGIYQHSESAGSGGDYSRMSSDSPKGQWSKQRYWTGLRVMPTLQPESASPERRDTPSPDKKFDPAFEAECRKVFLQVDGNKDNFITSSELVQGLFIINPEFSEEVSAEALEESLGELLPAYSANSAQLWSFEAFIGFMYHFRQF